MKRIALLTFLLAVGAARAGEIWVVGSAGRSVKVVDTASEAVVATIPLLQSAGAPSSRGIAFSTTDGQAGAFAFVGQGGALRVVDAGTRSVVKSVDLAEAIGIPFTIFDLESSPNRAFAEGGGAAVRAYLVVVGDAVRASGSPPEPYWVALDQRALVQSPSSVALVAASGFVNGPNVPAGDRGRAAGVSILGSPRGGAHLRLWVTSRIERVPETMRATLVEKGLSLDSPWLVGRSTERTLPMGRSAPESFAVAVPHDGEAQIFPAGAVGELVDLGHGGSCELPANLGAIAVRGPGAGGYQIVALDLDAGDLVRVNDSTCEYQRFELGSGPVDVTVDALFTHGSAWVANRDSDDLTVVRLDGSSARIALGPAPEEGCVECPVSIETRMGAGRACTTSVRLTKTATGVTIDWDGVGCTGVTYDLYCQCDRRLDSSCTCACDPLQTPGCFGSLPVEGQPGVENGLPGVSGPLLRHLPFDDGPMAYPPEPVLQLGATVPEGGGGGVWIGTRPP